MQEVHKSASINRRDIAGLRDFNRSSLHARICNVVALDPPWGVAARSMRNLEAFFSVLVAAGAAIGVGR